MERWSPRAEVVRMVEEVDRLISDATRRRRVVPRLLGFRPAIDLYDSGEQLVLKASLPGARPEDIDITIEQHSITIRGHYGFDLPAEEAERVTFYRRELGRRKFVETLTLPVPVDADQASAEFADGILTVIMPKTMETRPKRIPVQPLPAAE